MRRLRVKNKSRGAKSLKISPARPRMMIEDEGLILVVSDLRMPCAVVYEWVRPDLSCGDCGTPWERL